MDFYSVLHVAGFTFIQAACSTLLAFIIGLPAAFFCARRKFFGRRFLLSLSAVPFCIPSLLIALGYVTFLGLNGTLNQFLMTVFGLEKPPVTFLYSFAGLIIAHGFYNFALIMKNVSDVWEKLPSECAESARLLGAGEFRIFRTVTFRQLLPAVSSSCMLVFIYCFLSFVLVLLFGGIGNSTLEVEIYKAARASMNFKQAFLLSAFETFILCLMVMFYFFLQQKKSASSGIQDNMKNARLPLSGKTEYAGFVFLMLVTGVFFIFPLLGIAFNAFTSSAHGSEGSFTLDSFVCIFRMKSFIPSVKSTIYLGCCTAALSVAAGFTYSLFLRFNERKGYRKLNAFLNVAPMIPMCVSSVVLGLIFIMTVKRGNPFHLILAQTFMFWPVSFRVIYPQLMRISDATVDQAMLLARNVLDTAVRVILPVSRKSLLTAFGFAFAMSAGDTGLPLVMGISDFTTLSLFTYRLAGAYRFNEACASGVILGLLSGGILALGMILSRKGLKEKR